MGEVVVPPMPPPLAIDDGADAPLSRGKKVMKLLKTLLIAASVAIIVVGVAQTAMEFLFPDAPPTGEMPAKDQSKSPAAPAPGDVVPSRPLGAWLSAVRRGQAPRATGQDP